MPTGSLEFILRGGEYGTGLLAVTLYLLNPAAAAAPHVPFYLLPYSVLQSCFFSGLWQMAKALCPDVSQERRCTGQNHLSGLF